MKNKECLEASWEAQADLERAANDNHTLVVTLLDYHKFLDSIDPRFYAKMLQGMGIHRNFTNLLLDINTNGKRRIQIGNTYGTMASVKATLSHCSPHYCRLRYSFGCCMLNTPI